MSCCNRNADNMACDCPKSTQTEKNYVIMRVFEHKERGMRECRLISVTPDFSFRMSDKILGRTERAPGFMLSEYVPLGKTFCRCVDGVSYDEKHPLLFTTTIPLTVDSCSDNVAMSPKRQVEFHKGDHVHKVTGDYTFTGRIVSVFEKSSGQVRYVVENTDGVLHIFSASQLQLNSDYQKGG